MPRITPGLPTREQILDFITTSDVPAGKREIARAFGLHAQDKIALKALLKDMADEGLIDSAPGRAFHQMGGLPKVTVLRVVDVDEGGNVWAVPERWEAATPPPRLRVRERKRGALGVGERLLARTEEAGQGWIAHPMKVLAPASEQMLGVLRQDGERLMLAGVDKKDRQEYVVSDAGGAAPGDLVLAERAGRPPRVTARVTQRLGDPFAPTLLLADRDPQARYSRSLQPGGLGRSRACGGAAIGRHSSVRPERSRGTWCLDDARHERQT